MKPNNLCGKKTVYNVSSILYMDAIEFYTNGGGGGHNISKILKDDSESFSGGDGGVFHIPFGLYYNQFMESSTVLLDDVMKATVLDEDALFFSSTRKNKLRFKTTKKHK
jgi:hypothetical protein